MISPGTMLGGRYRLEERIASGGMGDVWRCVDDVLGRTVAVKILLPSLLEEAGFTERFRVEARTMATINHPGVVDIYDYGSDPTVGAYLVMEYVEGDALSRTLAGAAQLTAAGSVLGTATYISPEQAMGEQATALSDIYALGVVAYQCLAGRRPFEGENPLEIAMRHVREVPAPLPPDIPQPVRSIVERAMAKDPAARWPTASAFAAVARRAAADLAGAGGRPPAPMPPVAPGPVGPGPATPTPVPISPGVVPVAGATRPMPTP